LAALRQCHRGCGESQRFGVGPPCTAALRDAGALACPASLLAFVGSPSLGRRFRGSVANTRRFGAGANPSRPSGRGGAARNDETTESGPKRPLLREAPQPLATPSGDAGALDPFGSRAKRPTLRDRRWHRRRADFQGRSPNPRQLRPSEWTDCERSGRIRAFGNVDGGWWCGRFPPRWRGRLRALSQPSGGGPARTRSIGRRLRPGPNRPDRELRLTRWLLVPDGNILPGAQRSPSGSAGTLGSRQSRACSGLAAASTLWTARTHLGEDASS
jgi:hypothetical protein